MDAEIMGPLFWTVSGAVLSTLLSITVPIAISWKKYKNHPELLGNWASSYEGIDEPQGAWVNENLYIDTHLGKLRLKNSNSSEGYQYIAKCNLVFGNHIIGEWLSVRPGANARGAFVLTVCGQGECMYGYWVGSDRVGARRYGRWVLARTQQELADAKAHLTEMRKSRIQHANIQQEEDA